MKLHQNFIRNVLIGTLTTVALFSCSRDDDDSAGPNDGNYLPLAIGNYWNYVNDVRNEDTKLPETTDSIYALAKTTVNDLEYTDFGIRQPATGFTTEFMGNSIFRKDGSKLLLTGNLGIPVPGVETFQIPIEDGVFYDSEAQRGDIIFELPVETQQDLDGIPVNLTYNLTVRDAGDFGTYEVNDQSFSNVIASQLRLNLKVTTTVDVPILGAQDITILEATDVLVSDNYFAEGIGLIQSKAVVQYTLEDLSQFNVTLPIPETQDVEALQNITRYKAERE